MLIQVGSDRVLSALVVGDSAHSEGRHGLGEGRHSERARRTSLQEKNAGRNAAAQDITSRKSNYSRSGKGGMVGDEKGSLITCAGSSLRLSRWLLTLH